MIRAAVGASLASSSSRTAQQPVFMQPVHVPPHPRNSHSYIYTHLYILIYGRDTSSCKHTWAVS